MNGIMCVGHSSGEVTMWTPNMGSKPVVRMLTHPSAPVTSVSISRNGNYMATTGKDARLKVWDIRNTYKSLYDYFTPTPATSSSFSDTGLIAVGLGHEVHIWKNVFQEKQKAPYMKHRIPNRSAVHTVKFLPYEDVLGISHDNGYSSIIVPGSGEANFDAFEANPFETKKQRQEAEVHNLL
jgi:U3 small nucleolar RNA-associated protein 7